jgi:hypothetical protein
LESANEDKEMETRKLKEERGSLASTAAQEQLDLVAAGWPDALIKATLDDFTYVLKLRSGEIIPFTSADACVAPGWVRLQIDKTAELHQMPFPFSRGLDVRVSDVVWVADAPSGS